MRAELMPPVPQRLWHVPAVLNFAAGGLGAGFYLVSALSTGLSPSASLELASWLGPLLVFLGFGAVAMEATQPFRGPRVLARVRTSWMSRELWIGGVFAGLAVLDLLVPVGATRVLASLAAAAFVLAQGLVLRHARAVTAWSVPFIPPVFLASAVVSGAGLLALVRQFDRPPSAGAVVATLVALVVALAVWLAYLASSRDAAFMRATAVLRRGRRAVELVGLGYALPLVLLASALVVPAFAWIAMPLAGVAMIAGQALAKSALILEAGELRPIALDLTLRHGGRRS